MPRASAPARSTIFCELLGLTGIDTLALGGSARESKVSRICKELDEVVEAFRNLPLEGGYPYLWLDALYLKVRHTVPAHLRGDHHIVSQALIVAIGVRETGEREILGLTLGASEEYAFSLKGRRDSVAGLSALPQPPA